MMYTTYTVRLKRELKMMTLSFDDCKLQLEARDEENERIRTENKELREERLVNYDVNELRKQLIDNQHTNNTGI